MKRISDRVEKETPEGFKKFVRIFCRISFSAKNDVFSNSKKKAIFLKIEKRKAFSKKSACRRN